MKRAVFFGSDEFSLEILRRIIDRFEVTVVTIPDRRQGRGRRVTPSPVKRFCVDENVKFFTPDDPNEEGFVSLLRELNPDYIFLASYGYILKRGILSLVRYPLNVHPSLLPRYRGSAPIQRAIMNGERVTGVTVFVMDEKVDNGLIVLQEEVEIGEDETYGELRYRLALLGARLLMDSVSLIERGEAIFKPQRGEVTYARKIRKRDALISWERKNYEIKNLVRALNPRPLARTHFRERNIKVLKVSLSHQNEAPPGTVVAIDRKGPVVSTGEGSVVVETLRVEGKRDMSGWDFCNGYRVKVGERFG